MPNNTDGSGSGLQPSMKPTIDLIPDLIPDPPSKKQCENSLYKVYGPIDSQVDGVAIETVNENSVDVYNWSTSSNMQHKSYTSTIFTKKYLDVRFKYIGSTTKGWYNCDDNIQILHAI